MGFKPAAKPGPIALNESRDTTPSVTPMRPTPLTGNWCDLPWAGDESTTSTPGKINASGMEATNFITNVVASATAPTKITVQVPSSTIIASLKAKSMDACQSLLDAAGADAPPLSRALTAVPSDDSSDNETLQDLYLATPAASLLPEDFDDVGAPQHEVPAAPLQAWDQPAAATEPVQEDPFASFAAPSRAAHFVDFSRLQPTQLVSVRIGVAAKPTLPASYQQPAYSVPIPGQYHSGYYNQQPSSYAMAPRPAAPTVAHNPYSNVYCAAAAPAPMCPPRPVEQLQYQPLPQQRKAVCLVLVSRFPPPPPPNNNTLQTLLRIGSSFEAYYQITMRWYEKVCFSAPKAHPNVPPCPPAEQYLHDFDGWVEQLGLWWARHFTRKPKQARGARHSRE